MQYRLTNEQAKELYYLIHHTPGEECGQVASEWLSANLPAPIPVLRPIQEMPPEVPEGCFRLFGGAYQQGWQVNNSRIPADTHFMDVRPPELCDPEAELRKGFEAWAGEEGLDLSWSDGYTDACTAHAWRGFMARK